MSDAPNLFDAPGATPSDTELTEDDRMIRDTAKSSIVRMTLVPFGLALGSWLFDPCFLLSGGGFAGGVSALRTLRMMRIGLDELYPRETGQTGTVLAWIAVVVAGGKLLLTLLAILFGAGVVMLGR